MKLAEYDVVVKLRAIHEGNHADAGAEDKDQLPSRQWDRHILLKVLRSGVKMI